MTTELEEAMRIVREADPEAKMKIEMFEAVKGVDFMAEVRRGVPQPGPAGLDLRNAEIAERMRRSQAEQAERERRWAEQRAPSRETLIHRLSAGQAPDSVAMIKATIANGG